MDTLIEIEKWADRKKERGRLPLCQLLITRKVKRQHRSCFLISQTPQEKLTDMVCTLLNFLSYVLEPSLIAKDILWDLKRKTVVI